MSNSYLAKVNIGPNDINSGRSPLHQATCMNLFGAPSSVKSNDCEEPNSARLVPTLKSASVGPFRVRGHWWAVDSLARIFAKVKVDHPDLYAMIGTAGMLCCRLVRGSETAWSNHSWGFAIDLTIAGVLVQRGDARPVHGLEVLYGYFHDEGWYWGLGFPTPDPMHFEVSDEKVHELWTAGELFKVAV